MPTIRILLATRNTHKFRELAALLRLPGVQWRSLDVPWGRVEGGKGLAAEVWLDPLRDGWSTSYVSAIKRTEFELRPLGGTYELEIEAGPEVDLDRIERVQLLIGSNYWVKQN